MLMATLKREAFLSKPENFIPSGQRPQMLPSRREAGARCPQAFVLELLLFLFKFRATQGPTVGRIVFCRRTVSADTAGGQGVWSYCSRRTLAWRPGPECRDAAGGGEQQDRGRLAAEEVYCGRTRRTRTVLPEKKRSGPLQYVC
jgi:hypothetical protein